MQLFGLMWSGPSAHFWQHFTERLFRGKRDGATIIKKTLLDQLSYGPLCNAMYMAYVALVVEGAPSAGCLHGGQAVHEHATQRAAGLINLVRCACRPLFGLHAAEALERFPGGAAERLAGAINA